MLLGPSTYYADSVPILASGNVLCDPIGPTSDLRRGTFSMGSIGGLVPVAQLVPFSFIERKRVGLEFVEETL